MDYKLKAATVAVQNHSQAKEFQMCARGNSIEETSSCQTIHTVVPTGKRVQRDVILEFYA